MAEPQHLLDFQERLSQLTELEAIKEAYLAYIADAFRGYRLCKTPPGLSKSRVGLTKDRQDLHHLEIPLFATDACLHDELVCIVGHRDSLGRELAQWLEKPRALTLDRLQRALLFLQSSPEQIGQAKFFQKLRNLSHSGTACFASLLLHVESAAGLEFALRTELPQGAETFVFSPSILAAIVPNITELNMRWPAYKSVEGLRKLLLQIGELHRPCVSVACWPADSSSVPQYVFALQQGLQDARRLNDAPGHTSPVVVYASQWLNHLDENPGSGGENGRFSPLQPVDPHLRGGNARRLEE